MGGGFVAATSRNCLGSPGLRLCVLASLNSTRQPLQKNGILQLWKVTVLLGFFSSVDASLLCFVVVVLSVSGIEINLFVVKKKIQNVTTKPHN